MSGQQRNDSAIQMDVEYVRPRISLVFAIAAMFVLIILNVSFWASYLSVILWAVAASQLIRPITDECVKLSEKIQQTRSKENGNILLLVYRELRRGSPSSKHSLEVKGEQTQSFGSFIFANSTSFLLAAILFHLTQIEVFLAIITGMSFLLGVTSFIADHTGFTDYFLRSTVKREFVSTLVIVSILAGFLLIDLSILVAAVFELADLASEFSQSAQLLISQSSSVMASVTKELDWVYESINTLYNYGSEQFGGMKWWVVVEGLKESFENGNSSQEMAQVAINKLNIAYNGSDWLNVVEFALMAVVPGHRTNTSNISMTGLVDSIFEQISMGSLTVVTSNMVRAFFTFFSLSRDLLSAVSGLAGQALIFFLILYRLCKSSRDVITIVCLFTVPATTKDKRRLNEDLRNALRNAFTDPIYAANRGALVVFLVYGVLAIPWPFIAASFVYIVSIFHVFPESTSLLVVSLPWVSFQLVRAYLRPELLLAFDVWAWIHILRAIALPVVLLALDAYVNHSRASDCRWSVSPWLTDFSLAVGIAKFGLDGVILGPFLVAVSNVVLNFCLKAMEQDLWWDDMRIAASKKSSAQEHAKKQYRPHRGSFPSSRYDDDNLSTVGDFLSTPITPLQRRGSKDSLQVSRDLSLNDPSPYNPKTTAELPNQKVSSAGSEEEIISTPSTVRSRRHNIISI